MARREHSHTTRQDLQALAAARGVRALVDHRHTNDKNAQLEIQHATLARKKATGVHSAFQNQLQTSEEAEECCDVAYRSTVSLEQNWS